MQVLVVKTGIRFIADSLYPGVCCARDQLSPNPLWFSLLCRKWLWPSWSLWILEWNSTASITAMSYSQQMLPAIKHVAVDTFVFQQNNDPCHHTKDTIKLLQEKRRTSLVLVSGYQRAQTWTQWTIRSGVLCSKERMNVVWTVLMSWSCASLKSGTVCSRTLLTRPSTSGESDWERACVQRGNILNICCEPLWLTKVMDE